MFSSQIVVLADRGRFSGRPRPHLSFVWYPAFDLSSYSLSFSKVANREIGVKLWHCEMAQNDVNSHRADMTDEDDDSSDTNSYSSTEPSAVAPNKRQEKAAAGKTNKKVKKQPVRKFKEKWLKKFPWLLKSKKSGNFMPVCRPCGKELSCHKTAIERHGKSQVHRNSVAEAEKTTNLGDMWKGVASGKNAVADLEIKLSVFIAENNLPLSLSDSLMEFLKHLFPGNPDLSQVTLGKQKCTNVIRQVVGFRFMMDNVQKLRKNKFSVFVDETTDVGTINQCAVVAVTFDLDDYMIDVILLDMVELEKQDANTIANTTIKILEDRKIADNLIGFCADTCSTMFGVHHSVSTLLKDRYP